MSRWLAVFGIVALIAFGVVWLAPGMFTPPGPADVSVPVVERPKPTVPAREPGRLEAAPRAPESPAVTNAATVQNFLVLPNCRLNVIQRQEVPSQREGQLLYVATDVFDGPANPDDVSVEEPWVYLEVKPNEKVSDDELLVEENGTRRFRRMRENEKVDPTQLIIDRKSRKLRRLKEGDEVRQGQLLALVDPLLALDEFAIRKTKVEAAKADQQASLKTRDEAEERLKTMTSLRQKGPNVVPLEEWRGAKLTWDKYFFEEIAKRSAIKQTESELSQALTQLKLHEVRSKRAGVIKTLHKSEGEAIKTLDPIMLILHHDRIRAEGEVEMQHLVYLRKGMEVVLEPSQPARPSLVLTGHLQEVRGVAVARDRSIVSGGDDRTVRIWKRTDGTFDGQHRTLSLPTEVRCVTCTGAAAASNLAAAGGADGTARIWDLSQPEARPLELKEGHRGPINCVAFSPDGKHLVTGGVDRGICLWDATSGSKLVRFPEKHGGEVTSLQFLSDKELISTAGDKRMIYWRRGPDGNPQADPVTFDRRSGDVPVLGVNPIARQGLFDHGKELRLISLPEGQYQGVLQNPPGAVNFSTFALFSPDGKLVLTESASEGHLQLWRAPSGRHRAYELRQLIWPGEPALCGAFAPDLSDKPEDNFAVTGTRDRQVVVWALPAKEEIETELKATVTLIEQSLDSSSRQVRIHAELDNPKTPDGRRRLMPGAPATMVVYPK